MFLLWLLATCLIGLLFALPFLTNMISAVLLTLAIFFFAVLFLFALNVEFTAILLMLLVVGAFIVLIVFTFFVLNQHKRLTHALDNTSWLFTFGYVLFTFKLLIFFSSWKSFGLTQTTIGHQLFEAQAYLPLFDLSSSGSYGLMLLLIGLLLFLLTVCISLLLKSK